MPSRLSKLADLMRRFGWRQSLHTVLLWILRQLVDYRSAIVFRLDLSDFKRLPGSQRFEWSYKLAGEIAPFLWRDADIQGSSQEAPPGSRYFVGTLNQKQCYLSVVSHRGFAIPRRGSVAFTADSEAYVGNCVTLDTHRGMGFYPSGLSELGLTLHSEGVRWLYLFVERENLASIRGVEKAGFHPVAECSVYRWRGHPRQHWTVLPGIKHPELIQSWKITTQL